jgi:hypothetical protein
MFARLPLVGFCVALCLAGWFYFRGEASPPAADVTCRQLADDPGAYAGLCVRVSTAGCGPAADLRALAWRPYADAPAAVILSFAAGVPDPAPAHVTGTVGAVVPGRPVVVSGCR